jgi:hypothetical protein
MDHHDDEDVDDSLRDIAHRIDFDWTERLRALLVACAYSEASKRLVVADIHGHGFLLRSERAALDECDAL